jgi:hypothetical protein
LKEKTGGWANPVSAEAIPNNSSPDLLKKMPQLFSSTTYIFCIIFLILYCHPHGARNLGGLPGAWYHVLNRGAREASDLPLEALL